MFGSLQVSESCLLCIVRCLFLPLNKHDCEILDLPVRQICSSNCLSQLLGTSLRILRHVRVLMNDLIPASIKLELLFAIEKLQGLIQPPRNNWMSLELTNPLPVVYPNIERDTRRCGKAMLSRSDPEIYWLQWTLHAERGPLL